MHSVPAAAASPGEARRSFPMLVLPVSKALELDSFPKHEDIKVDLVEWSADMGPCAFFSHTWLGWSHPDGVSRPKWSLLKALLRKAVDGRLKVMPHASAVALAFFE